MAVTIELPADEVEELTYNSVDEELTGRSRWGVYIDSIVEYEGSFYRVSWEDGATESQDYNSFSTWGGEPEMTTLTKVVKKSIVKDTWVDADE